MDLQKTAEAEKESSLRHGGGRIVRTHLIPALGRRPWVNGDASRSLQFGLTTPVVWWGGWPFFKRGWRSVAALRLNTLTLDSQTLIP